MIVALQKIATGLDETIAAVGEIIEKTEPVAPDRRRHQRQPRRRRRRARRPAGQEGRDGRRDRAWSTACTRARPRQGFRNFPDSATTQGAADLRRSTRAARSRSRGSAARRRSPPPARTARRCATRVAGSLRRARALPRRTGPAARRSSAPTPPSNTRHQMQTPAPFEYERATSLEGAIASLREHEDSRIIAGGHSLLPMMKLRLAQPVAADRHQRPHGPAVHPRGGRRDRDRRAHPPRRAARVRAAARALPGLPRRRAGDRRPGGAQPRHDRRLALPGRRGRGPVRGLRGAEGRPSSIRGRRRHAHRADERVPPRPVDDRGRRRRDPHRDPLQGPAGRGQRAREGRAARGRLGDRGGLPPRCGSTAARSPTSASRSARSA